ncbi:MAG: 50S ribosomal L9 C-terminal domain-containing protein [Candidatus Karelsulcia muelleri]
MYKLIIHQKIYRVIHEETGKLSGCVLLFKIKKKFLFLEKDPIKQIGVFPCKIILHPKVHSKFEFEVSYKKVLIL